LTDRVWPEVYKKLGVAPIINAYKPHDDPPLLSDLRRELLHDNPQITRLSFKEICKQTKAL